jgi:undecaprenyl-phosphate 4-deoxy-4-formamido-L-arabinose transferase
MSRTKSVAPLASISAVVPVYNSDAALPELVERLKPVMAALARKWEIIFVDDNSRDDSWRVIRDLAKINARVSGLHLARNYGQHNAVLCGVRQASGEVIITIDDDLQHPPEELPKLVAALDDGYDVVYGVPDQMQHGTFRRLSSRMTKFALKTAMGIGVAPDVSALRAFRGDLARGFEDFRGSYVSFDVLLAWTTTNFGSVRVRHDERKYGRSNYTFWKLVVHATNMMTGYSSLPLRLASLMGFASAILGVVVLAFVLVRFLITGYSIPGFPFLASTIAIFAGAELFSLGIIGEYLARIHMRSLDRPQYVIRGTTFSHPPRRQG